MPIQSEQSRVHPPLFALHLSTQDVILTRQSGFKTRNEVQKLAVELEAFETKQQPRHDRGGRNGGSAGTAGKKGHYSNNCPEPKDDRWKKKAGQEDIVAVLLCRPESDDYPHIAAMVALAVRGEMYHLVALLDIGAISNFISQTVVKNLAMGKGETVSRGFRTLEWQPLRTYEQHAVAVTAVDSTARSADTIGIFIAADFVGFDIVLGLPWLTRWNVNIQAGNDSWWFARMSDVTARATMTGSKGETAVVPSHGWVVEVIDNHIDDLFDEYRVGLGRDVATEVAS
ncbi:hypothetical protein MMC29_000205 [Sticta canariensis]|nr:hypothetical protein [Sticta canariensis]